MIATFETDCILLGKYPFPSASIYPHGRVACASIRDVDPTAGPLEIRTNNGETLFVSAEQSADFQDWVTTMRLPIVRRIDAWHLLLEPFLDTDFTTEQQEQTLAALAGIGLSRSEVMQIRRSVEHSMWAYNSIFWDWAHLGLFDVLSAMNRLSISHRLFRKRYNAFYWSAMELADRGHSFIAERPAERQSKPRSESD
jgi:hypothetical protein